MSKEEKIIEAYGEYWNLTNGNLNDDYSFDFIGSFSDYDLGTKFKIIFTGISMFRAIPFSIVGIENNNGWIKIESEKDLPEYNGKYHVRLVYGELSIKDYENTSYFRNEWSRVTHYQEVAEPQPPIY